MNQWWQYWHKKFTDDACNKIVSDALTLPASVGTIGHGSNTFVKDAEYRRSQIRWIPKTDPRFTWVITSLSDLFFEGNKNAFGFDLSTFNEIQFTEYSGQDLGKYDWHHDTHWTTSQFQQRKLSVVIQLSNSGDYTGGDLELAESECGETPPPRVIREKGTVIMFPSFLSHRVTPVTSGTRYSLVAWHEGPVFK
jgi:PKHD-type hydroxylase